MVTPPRHKVRLSWIQPSSPNFTNFVPNWGGSEQTWRHWRTFNWTWVSSKMEQILYIPQLTPCKIYFFCFFFLEKFRGFSQVSEWYEAKILLYVISGTGSTRGYKSNWNVASYFNINLPYCLDKYFKIIWSEWARYFVKRRDWSWSSAIFKNANKHDQTYQETITALKSLTRSLNVTGGELGTINVKNYT